MTVDVVFIPYLTLTCLLSVVLLLAHDPLRPTTISRPLTIFALVLHTRSTS